VKTSLATPALRSCPPALALALLWAALLPAGAASAKGAGQDPSKLAKAHFYEKAAYESIRKGTLDPNEYLDGTPWQVEFQKAGRVQIDLGQETESCSVAAEEVGKSWALTLKCSSGSQHATWTWLDDKRAETDLFDAGRPGDFNRRTTEVVRLDRPFNAVLAEVESRFSEKALAALAGTWKDEAGAKLVLSEQVKGKGKFAASFDGGRWAARVLSCPTDPQKPKEQVRCLELTGPEEKSVFFAAMPGPDKGSTVLVEGMIPPDPAGHFFEKKAGGRTLARGK
jgi:hypothetical protein